MTVRVRLDLGYDGRLFSGWAHQPGLRTVEGTVVEALARLRVPRPVKVTVAGRTDAGVHARGQVAHVDLPTEVWTGLPGRSTRTPAEALLAKLAGLLPEDVVVHQVVAVPSVFDARFGALHRRYAYRISDRISTRDPVRRADVLWHRRVLDVEAMDRASVTLQGEHDFRAFCRPRPGATTVRTLQAFRWRRCTEGGDVGLVVATVQADAFCHNMVRALVGGAIAVGEGRRAPEWLAEVLAARVRDPAVPVMPAGGLTLEQVTYPCHPDGSLDLAGLNARQQRSRAMRVLGGGGGPGDSAVGG